jgi:hypothetical protein
MTDEQWTEIEQRKAEVLKALAPLGFSDLDDGELPGGIYISGHALLRKPGMPSLTIDVARYGSVEALLKEVLALVANHAFQLGHSDMQFRFRQLMNVAAPAPRVTHWQIEQAEEQERRAQQRLEERMRQIAREEVRRS